MERLPRLKVDGPVLHLQQDVVAELAVERLEFAVGLLRAVVGLILRVHEGAPHHDPAVRSHRVGEHIGAVRVCTVVVLRARLTFGVGFDQEAAEVGDGLVDLIRLGAPPGPYGRVEWIGCLQAADLHGRAESRAHVNANSIGPEHIRKRCRLLNVSGCQGDRAGVHAGDHGAVDADRRTRAGVVRVARIQIIGQREPVPDRASRVATLHRPIQIVPMVQHPMLQARGRGDVEMVRSLASLHQPQEVECPVQHTHIAVRRDDGRPMTCDGNRADDIPFGAGPTQIKM